MSVATSFKINAKKIVVFITMAAKYCEILDFRE